MLARVWQEKRKEFCNLLVNVGTNFLYTKFLFTSQKSVAIGDVEQVDFQVEIDRGLPPQFVDLAAFAKNIFLIPQKQLAQQFKNFKSNTYPFEEHIVRVDQKDENTDQNSN